MHQLPSKPEVDMSSFDDDRRGGGGRFRRDRDDNSYSRRDSFGRDIPDPRKRRDRSDSREDDRRKRRRSLSPRGPRGGGGGPDGDHYIPNYDRDGYVPPPRFGGGGGGSGGGGYEPHGMNSGGNRGNRIDDPLELDYQLSFRQFVDFAKQKHRDSRSRDSLDDDEIRRRYQTYRDKYQVKILSAFVDEHKGSEWFREKYHPIESLPLKEEIASRKKTFYPKFIEELNLGKLDEITFDEIVTSSEPADEAKETKPAVDAMETTEGGEEAKKEEGAAPTPSGATQTPTACPAISPLNLNALFVKSIPVNVKRHQILEMCKKVEGFLYLVVSDPRPDKKYSRLGWLVFDEKTNLEKAMDELNNKKSDDFTMSLAMHNNVGIRTKTLPAEFNSPERLERDLENAKRLVKALDQETGINNIDGGAVPAIESRLEEMVFSKAEYQEAKDEERMDEDEHGLATAGIDKLAEGPSAASVKKNLTAQTKLLLDVFIEYLRRVHWYDFYSGCEADGPEDFCRRAWVQLRKTAPASGAPAAEDTSKSNNRPYMKTEYQRISERLDSRVALRTLILSPGSWGGEELEKLGGKNPEAEIDSMLNQKFIAKIEAEKYRCKDCTKLFKGEEFVRKHIRLKHPEIVKTLRVDVDFYNAYVRDPNRVNPWHAAGSNSNAFGGPMPPDGISVLPPISMGQPGMWPPQPPPMMMGMDWMGGGAGGYYGGGGGGGRGGRHNMSARLGPPIRNGNRGAPPPKNLPVDPRSRMRYDDLDAPKGEDSIELDYD
ncbi:hypothetical protein HDU96_007479 [Phlyctochytrium bullatum]|nr:hypothetical protein HDU96_007479 [Phlyctochytrium bullatum]